MARMGFERDAEPCYPIGQSGKIAEGKCGGRGSRGKEIREKLLVAG